MRVLLRALRQEGCSNDLQRRIRCAVEAGLVEALDSDVPEDLVSSSDLPSVKDLGMPVLAGSLTGSPLAKGID